MHGLGDIHEKHKEILTNWSRICALYSKLIPAEQAIVKDFLTNLGERMAEYIMKPIETMQDFDEYCQVAVTLTVEAPLEGLYLHNLEDGRLGDMDRVIRAATSMWQKADIISDVLEDHVQGRILWPKCIWNKYVDNFDPLFEKEFQDAARRCLNDMCLDAIRYVQ